MRERPTDELIEEAAEPLPPMALETVVPTMSSPARGPWSSESEPTAEAVALAPVPDQPVATDTRRRELELAIVVGLGGAGWFATADVRVAILVFALGFAVIGLRWTDRHLPFSFGQGFIGYRADLGWPRGVQEDDDVHWNWRTASPAASRDRNG